MRPLAGEGVQPSQDWMADFAWLLGKPKIWLENGTAIPKPIESCECHFELTHSGDVRCALCKESLDEPETS